MTEMSFLNSDLLWGDLLSPFSPSGLGAEDSLSSLDDYLEEAKPCKSHGLSGDKAEAVSSDWLALDGLVNAADCGREDAFSGMDWMVEKMDLKEFDFDALLGTDDLESTCSELIATLEDSCDLFGPLAASDKESPSTVNSIGQFPETLLEPDRVTPLTSHQSFPLSLRALTSTPDHSFSLELGSEVDVLEGDRKPEAVYGVRPKDIKEEEAPSDNDSGIGICTSPESYLGSPQHSPSTSLASLNDSQLSSDPGFPPARPKPYDRPFEDKKEKKVDKKLKKMEQNKTAATRYRQKKRAEQEALSGECRELEQKNEALKEKADALSKEIQYLKDLIEEVRKAKEKRKSP
ncbi:cyclic AMP-dependent transcription factor ATF-4 [Phascolarctos cinereus]|uniref:Cyclic AMP-dependent transcription factor ATF-4 n=1 Tax=Phascolarctos cinereus TaxID=38626 RepID=A0A6P5JZY5_PHACI|nr:cyclic AMP-dependent transcription factor ATF-4 [Phascolarctos cinereus]